MIACTCSSSISAKHLIRSIASDSGRSSRISYAFRHILCMLKRMHQGMHTQVLQAGRLGRAVPMRRGVRQGSVEGPTLFLLFYSLVLSEWRRCCSLQLGPNCGVEWILSRDGTLRRAHQLFIRGQCTPRTQVFKYLGSLVAADASFGVDADVQRRIGLAWGAYGQLKHVWATTHLSRAVKAAVLRSCVAPVLLYGCESWTMRARHLRALSKTWLGLVKGVCGVAWVDLRDDRVTSAELLRRAGLPSLHDAFSAHCRLAWSCC